MPTREDWDRPLADLSLFDDTESVRSGAMNMAIDELLMRDSVGPWLRCYGWECETISIGHFAPVPLTLSPCVPVIRRWTGGGAVTHGGVGDATFALGIPRQHPASAMRPKHSYRWLHRALQAALVEIGVESTLAADEVISKEGSGGCFQNPVAADLLSTSRRKIAGGAQRRSRHGMLHQGSIQGVRLTSEFPSVFAAQLADSWQSCSIDPGLLRRAEELARTKYRPLESPD